MKRILFVCHGNICRSPMAEYVMRHLIRERGLEDEISCDSAAATRDALGMLPHPGTRRVLASHNIPCGNHRARMIRKSDLARYDLICGMDQENLSDMRWLLGPDPDHKVHLLLDWTARPRDVADPWYTDDYETTFNDVWEGVSALLDALVSTGGPSPLRART